MLEFHKDLINIVEAAIMSFNEEEEYLIASDLSERCICARFAMHLSKALINTRYQDYDVDVEYNRGAYGKDLSAKIIENKRIVVDLIVHRRGYNCETGYDNLICIEMKKSTDRRGCSNDEERLRKMTDCGYGFNYKIAAMILVNMKECRLEIKEVFY